MFDGAPAQLPMNAEIEQAVLGAVLMSRRSYDDFADILRPEHFGFALHGRIFEACAREIDAGHMPTPVSLAPIFAGDDALQQAGGTGYLVRLAMLSPLPLNNKHYASTVVDLWKRRQMILSFTGGIERASKTTELDANLIASETEQSLSEITADGTGRSEIVDSGTAADEAIAQAERAYQHKGPVDGVPSGVKTLDELIGVMERGNLIIVAGRPSMGKTALASAIVGHAAKHFLLEHGRNGGRLKRVVEFELEMSRSQMARRRLSAMSGIPIKNLKHGWLNQADFNRLTEERARLARLPISTDDSSGLSVADIRLRARRFARRNGLGLIMVDHLGLIRGGKDYRGNRTAEISDITAELKVLAKELDVPVIALSQLSRKVEEREDKRPMLADLRDSGSIEQDADIVMFVYREEYYLKRSEPQRLPNEKDDAWTKRHSHWLTRCEATAGVAEIIVAKQRDGETGTAKCRFDAAHAAFKNLDQEEMEI